MESDITNNVKKARSTRLQDYRFELRLVESGHVVSVGDGIAWVSGLPSAAIDDVLAFEDGSAGVVFDLTRDGVGAILLKQTANLSAGVAANPSRETLQIPVGDGLLGRVRAVASGFQAGSLDPVPRIGLGGH